MKFFDRLLAKSKRRTIKNFCMPIKSTGNDTGNVAITAIAVKSLN
jgi:hypothetical protein